MLQSAQVLVLMVASVDPTGATPASNPAPATTSVTETATKVVAARDRATATTTPSATPDPVAPTGVKIVHEDGATTLTLDNAEISFSNRLQFRFTDEMEGACELEGRPERHVDPRTAQHT